MQVSKKASSLVVMIYSSSTGTHRRTAVASFAIVERAIFCRGAWHRACHFDYDFALDTSRRDTHKMHAAGVVKKRLVKKRFALCKREPQMSPHDSRERSTQYLNSVCSPALCACERARAVILFAFLYENIDSRYRTHFIIISARERNVHLRAVAAADAASPCMQ